METRAQINELAKAKSNDESMLKHTKLDEFFADSSSTMAISTPLNNDRLDRIDADKQNHVDALLTLVSFFFKFQSNFLISRR